MKRTFTVTEDPQDKVIYEGFNRRFYPPCDVEYVAVVLYEGKAMTFVIENPCFLSPFMKFLDKEYETANLIGIFERT